MTRRWRPSLALVLGGALAGTLGLSFVGLVSLRYLGPEIGFRNAAILLGASITLATVFLGWLLVRLLLRPIRALEAYAVAAEAGQAGARPAHFGTRELHATARRVIAMAETLRDREAAVRAFSDHVTHEIRTPVSAIRAAAELLVDGTALGREDAELVAQIDSAAAEIDRQLSALRAAVRARDVRYRGTVTLAALLPELAQVGPTLQLTARGEDVALPIGAEGLKIVLIQLLRNAAENGAKAVFLEAAGEGAGVRLRVADDGPGISPGNAPRVFDPFFTTRRGQGGTGMGLAIVRNLLEAHGGAITVAPVAVGAVFVITFPGRPG